jgi:hypothetical protein
VVNAVVVCNAVAVIVVLYVFNVVDVNVVNIANNADFRQIHLSKRMRTMSMLWPCG